MRILIAEDDLASRKFISKFMSSYGECDVTVDGIEAIEAFILGLDSRKPYDLICLDVMMPKVDGIKALKTIRELEEVREIDKSKRAKIIVATALGETNYVMSAFETGMEVYVNKPIDLDKLEEAIQKLGLL
ncbi:response regulator [Petroclostridium sp. X23]|uniref:response regulator n=1 Tax=Petroclostridium sp. X23 TaxID=3045146 RepID=UPI0024AE6F5B|nr:response regulator [Petroclostridium sp. X23]WHH61353.1 response regulator [Petroclostridium sp. X23]